MGQPYAPEPMIFLRDLVEASEHLSHQQTGTVLWGICPSCRRKQTIAQLDVVREAG